MISMRSGGVMPAQYRMKTRTWTYGMPVTSVTTPEAVEVLEVLEVLEEVSACVMMSCLLVGGGGDVMDVRWV
jgi:hypothetical protein